MESSSIKKKYYCMSFITILLLLFRTVFFILYPLIGGEITYDLLTQSRNYSLVKHISWNEINSSSLLGLFPIRHRTKRKQQCYVFPSYCTNSFEIEVLQRSNLRYAIPKEETTSLMANLLRFCSEEYESSLMDTVFKIIEEADIHKEHGCIFLDVGAHYGAWTLGMAHRFSGQKTTKKSIIHSFDIFEEYLESMDISIRLNNFQNSTFHLHTTAVAEKSFEEGLVSIRSGNKTEWITTQLSSLDRLYADKVFPCPSFIRFDIDLLEFDAILGAEKLLLECFPIVLIVVPCRILVRSYVKFLERNGYSMGWIIGLKCAKCQRENWYERTGIEPMLIGVPLGQEYLLEQSLIVAIPQSQYFDNYYFSGGLLEVDHYRIHLQYSNGEVETIRHLNESIPMNFIRCNDIPSQHINYLLRMIERIPVIEEELYLPGIADIDPTDPSYRELFTPGVYYLFNSSTEDQSSQKDLIDEYYKDANRIRFVSAYYDISRSSWSSASYARTNDQYFRYFKPYLSLDTNLVLFLDDRMIEAFLSLIEDVSLNGIFRCKLLIVLINAPFLEEHIEAFQYFEIDRQIAGSEAFRNSSIYHSVCKDCFNGNYTATVHMKVDFVKFAIENIYESKNSIELNTENQDFIYAWTDFGFFKRYDEIPSRPLDISRIRDNGNRLSISAILPADLYDWQTNERIVNPNLDRMGDTVIMTCVFMGKKEVITKYRSYYHEAVREFHRQQLIVTDQHIVLKVFQNHPEMFDVLYTRFYSKMLRFLQVVP